MLGQIIRANFQVGEVSCPAAYFEEASSIHFSRAVRYGLGVLGVSVLSLLDRMGWPSIRIFDANGRRLTPKAPSASS